MNARVTILGAPIDAVSMTEALAILRAFAAEPRFHHVMTPNPEMLVEGTKNPAFLRVLQSADLNVPDGTGLLFVSRLLGTPLRSRVTGADLTEAIAGEPALQPVFFLGAAPGVAAKAAEALRSRHPELIVAGMDDGSPRTEDEDRIVRRITESGAKTLIVAYGAPTQDLWVARVRSRLPNVRVALGVGGTFDYLASVLPRAPVFVRSLGLEWMWRLFLQPKRLPRIFRAVLVFPVLALIRGAARNSAETTR